MRRSFLAISILSAGASSVFAADVAVKATVVEDRKAVIATVEPVRQLVARARIGGTIAQLKVKEGDEVAAGVEVATVADQKLVLQMQALEQRIRSQQAQRDQARTDFERIQELQRRGVSTQTQLDQARTMLDVAERNLAAMQADYSVIEQQMSEGAVVAPGAGRVLSVPGAGLSGWRMPCRGCARAGRICFGSHRGRRQPSIVALRAFCVAARQAGRSGLSGGRTLGASSRACA